MALRWDLTLGTAGLTGPARGAAAALDRLDAKLRVVDRSLGDSARTKARAAAASLRGDTQTTASFRSAAAKRQREADREARSLRRLADTTARARASAEDRVTAAAARGVRAREALARQAAAGVTARARRTQLAAAQEAAADARGNRVQAPNGRQLAAGAAGLAATVFTAIGAYGSGLQEQTRASQGLDYRIAQLAGGDIGDAGAAPEIRAAVERTSSASGLAPQDVLEGLSRAQGSFSALDTAERRTDYLTRVLPELARVAVGTNTPLQDVVASAGELQRQLGIGNRELPDTLARVIVQGRKGAVTFTDMARHLGELGGMSARFLRTSGADSARATALTGTLFQFAGRAGGTGDEAATRVRGLLGNFTSREGQGRLRRLFGTDVLDRTGQLRAAAGQTQDDAFIRMIESAYTRTHGNAGQFLTAIGGNDQQGRALADQMFQDLQRNHGRLTEFRALDEGAAGATAATVQRRAFDAAINTDAGRAGLQENRTFFNTVRGPAAGAADLSDRQVAELRERNSALGFLADNQGTRGVLTGLNYIARGANVPAGYVDPTGRTEGQVLHEHAARVAASQYNAAHPGDTVMGSFGRIYDNIAPEARDAEIARLTREVEARLTAGLPREFLDRPVRMAPETLTGVQEAVRAGVVEGLQGHAGNGGAAPGAGASPRGGLGGGL